MKNLDKIVAVSFWLLGAVNLLSVEVVAAQDLLFNSEVRRTLNGLERRICEELDYPEIANILRWVVVASDPEANELTVVDGEGKYSITPNSILMFGVEGSRAYPINLLSWSDLSEFKHIESGLVIDPTTADRQIREGLYEVQTLRDLHGQRRSSEIIGKVSAEVLTLIQLYCKIMGWTRDSMKVFNAFKQVVANNLREAVVTRLTYMVKNKEELRHFTPRELLLIVSSRTSFHPEFDETFGHLTTDQRGEMMRDHDTLRTQDRDESASRLTR